MYCHQVGTVLFSSYIFQNWFPIESSYYLQALAYSIWKQLFILMYDTN